MRTSKLLVFFLIVLLFVPQQTAARDQNTEASTAARETPLSMSGSTSVTAEGGLATSLQLSITDALPSPQDPPATLRTRFEPSLLKRLLAATDDEPVRGIVLMRERADLEQMSLAGMDRPARIRSMLRQLQSVAERSQVNVRALLDRAQEQQQVKSYEPLWIVNAIAVEGLAEAFWTLATHPDVSIILEDHVHYLPDAEQTTSQTAVQALQADEIQWNVQRVQADRVWQVLGIDGAGAVVASLDSGVDWDHPLLKTRYRGYTGKPFVEHAGNWYCATSEGYTYPGDGLGHGTHTMGTMVGENGIGVAPGARWIAAKVFDNQGLAYDSWIHAGFQWVLAPNGDPDLAPDVVNNSWGNVSSANQQFLPDVQALRSAGIVPVFSAGNYGPGKSTLASPGSFRESFAVGATDSADRVARFSSRGPSPWDEIKPEVSAPGVDILSSLPGGALGIKNGTSMAAPHVVGLVAMVRQVNPLLTVDEIERVLQETALPLGEEYPNNDYGWGLVDAYAAVTRAGSYGRLAGQVTDAGSGAPLGQATVHVTAPGDTISITTHTDAAGNYAIGLGADYYDVTVSAFGYGPVTTRNVEITMGVTITLDAALIALPVGVLEGSVRQAGTDAALQAIVRVPGAPPTTTADPGSGAYALRLPVGSHVVRVECPAHRFVTATVTISDATTTYRDFWLESAPTILLVDSGAWYNDSQILYYQDALEGLHYLYDRHVIVNVDIYPTDVPTADTFLPYDLVIWSAPSDAPGLIGAQEAITHYLDGGGRLLLSGQDIAFWDGGLSGTHWATYLKKYLKATPVRDNAASRTLQGNDPAFAGITATIAGVGGADNQYYPDVIASTDPDHATSVWTYSGDGSGGQAVGLCLPFRALYFAFGFEGINDATVRSQIMERSIQWLTRPPQQAGIDLRPGQMPQIERRGGWITHELRLRNTGEVSSDTYELGLAAGTWPAALVAPEAIALSACQSATLAVSVHVPIEAGWHSYSTATLTARSTLSSALSVSASLVSKTPAPVLLVDGSRFFQLDGQYRDALAGAGIGYDYHQVKNVWPVAIPTTDTLSMYPMVVWYTAYDWYLPLSVQEEDRLSAYLDGGGRLFLSSQDYLYYSHDHALAQGYLGVLGHIEDINTTQVWGEPLHPVGWDLGPYTLSYTYTNWSDGLIPTADARTALRGQHYMPAAITHQGDGWRTVFAAFSFETLDPEAAETVMERTIGWLSWLGSSSWEADRRTVGSGSEITMTCVLRNDGWEDIVSAHFSTTLPAELSWVDGSLSPGATYHVLTRTVDWQGPLSRNEAFTVRFRVRSADSLPELTTVRFPARLGYDDHDLYFERPTILRVNGPDLSASNLVVEPAASLPRRVLTYTLTVRNDGVRDATATISATSPPQAVFTGTLDSGGSGSGNMISSTLSWTGEIAAGDQAILRYHLALDGSANYWLIHDVQVSDQTGERWYPEARTLVWTWKHYLPVMAK